MAASVQQIFGSQTANIKNKVYERRSPAIFYHLRAVNNAKSVYLIFGSGTESGRLSKNGRIVICLALFRIYKLEKVFVRPARGCSHPFPFDAHRQESLAAEKIEARGVVEKNVAV